MQRLSVSLCFALLACSVVFLQCSPEPPSNQDASVTEKEESADKCALGDGDKCGSSSACTSDKDCKPDEYCDEDKCVQDKCKPGTTICDNKGEAVLTCNEAGSIWDNPKPCAADELCQDGKCVTKLCSPGEKKCEQGGIAVCNKKGTAFDKPTPCKADEYCEKGGCLKQTCKPDSKTCEGETAKICNATGSAYEDKPCGANQFCDEGVCKDRLCTPGEKSCDGNNARTCNKRGAGYDTIPCSSQETCEAGGCKAKLCTPNEKRCANNTTAESCDAKGLGWTKTPCGSGEYCDKGSCTKQQCTPGEKECVNATQSRTCKTGGSGWDVTPCQSGEGCDTGGVCKKQLCTPGEKRCTQGETSESCAANGLSWAKTPCQPGEYCEQGTCKTQQCKPGTKECASNTLARTCNANGSAWINQPCQSGESCDAAVCKKQICTPNATRCAGSFALETCDAKGLSWVKTSCSSSEYCDQGSCQQQACPPNKQECVSASQMRTCAANGSAWANQPCQSGETCDSGSCKKQICTPNQVSCANGTTIQTCDSRGLSASTQPCGAGQYCYQGQCFAGTCKAGVQRCQGNDLEICQSQGSGNAWVKQRTCAMGCSASGDKAYCTCTPGSEQCNGNDLEVCQANGSDSIWKVVSSCTHGCYVTQAKAYCKCAGGRTENQYYCDGNDRYVCKASRNANGEGTKQNSCTYGCYNGTGTTTPVTDQFSGSTLLNNTQKSQINNWIGTPKQNWVLCYKLSVYGSSTDAFHKHCDNKGPTVTVVKFNGGKANERLVGGYASQAWGTANGYFGDKDSFLFSLTNSHKHNWFQNTSYVLSSATNGPTWGGGHDLTTGSSSVIGNNAYCNLGFTYRCRIGTYGGSDCRNDFCGSDGNVVVSEVEVFYKDPNPPQRGTAQAYCKCPGGKQPGEHYCSGKTSYFCQFDSIADKGHFASHDCAGSCEGAGYCQCTHNGKTYNHATQRCDTPKIFACTQHRLYEGTWSEKTDCAANGCLETYASPSSATAVCNICIPNTYRCSGNDSEKCTNPGSAYAWTKNTTCTYGCHGPGFCKCPGGRTTRQAYCQGNERYICDESYQANGQGRKQNTCAHGCYNGTGPATGDTDLFNGGTLLTYDQMKQVNTWVGTPFQGWTLCYKRSVHGTASATFHSRCDDKGVTVTVIKLSTGKLIGGYASQSWSSRSSYLNGASSSFLFSLTNKHKHVRNQKSTHYVYDHRNYGPTWGGGHDFYTNLNTSTYCNLGYTYLCRVGGYGSSACRDDFCGTYRPGLVDVEVYYKGGVPLGGSAQAYCKCTGGVEGNQQFCSGKERYQCNASIETSGNTTKLGDCPTGCVVKSDGKAYCQ